MVKNLRTSRTNRNKNESKEEKWTLTLGEEGKKFSGDIKSDGKARVKNILFDLEEKLVPRGKLDSMFDTINVPCLIQSISHFSYNYF